MRVSWLADCLRDGGLDVIEDAGWRGRGKDSLLSRLDPQVIVCHHTASNEHAGEFPQLSAVRDGKPGVSGPLAQLLIGRGTGRVYVIANGVANDAGKGGWMGYSGNRKTIGIEAENNGLGEPWSGQMVDAYANIVACLLEQLGLDTNRCCGHKEWAPGRKFDPTFDMNVFRTHVNTFRTGPAPVPLELDMITFVRDPDNGSVHMIVGATRKWFGDPAVLEHVRNHYKVNAPQCLVAGGATIDWTPADIRWHQPLGPDPYAP